MKLQQPIAVLFSLLLSWSVYAEVKTITYELDATDLQQLHLQVGVGLIKLTTADTDTIQLQVDVTGEKRWWFFSYKVDNVVLSQRRTNGTLTLSIDEDNTKQRWHLSIPRSLIVHADLGVGQFFAEQLAADTTIDVGVGQVSVNLDTNQFQQITLTAGVGNVQIKNAPAQTKLDRHLVGGSLEIKGSGLAVFEASVGVGDISLSHQ